MEKIIAFFLENWKLVAFALCLCVELVIFLVRKKPVKVVDSIKEDLIPVIIGAINAAETSVGDGHGDVKKDLVIKAVESFVNEKYPEVDFKAYKEFVSLMLEIILSTPQKKGE